MDEESIEKASRYTAARGLQLRESLGFGIHGTVFVVESESAGGNTALKIFADPEAYARERAVYHRLDELKVVTVRGLKVPKMLRWDDDLLAIEMTVVKPPFILDFASAHLDFSPRFSEEVWEEWRRKNEKQFGARWAAVELILAQLEGLGIYMLDPSPHNIRFE
jgi:hypothetical protein